MSVNRFLVLIDLLDHELNVRVMLLVEVFNSNLNLIFAVYLQAHECWQLFLLYIFWIVQIRVKTLALATLTLSVLICVWSMCV